MKGVLKRSLQALKTLPDGRGWFETGAAIVAMAAVLGPAGLATGLLRFDPRPLPEGLLLAAVALPVPAIAEELVFRGPIPSESETRRPLPWIVGSAVMFTAWHVLEGRLFPGAEVLLRPDFLMAALAIGLACGFLRHRTGSLWPPVLLHWAAAATWISLSGGPSLSRLFEN